MRLIVLCPGCILPVYLGDTSFLYLNIFLITYQKIKSIGQAIISVIAKVMIHLVIYFEIFFNSGSMPVFP